MITHENQIGKKPGKDCSYPKVKQIHYERIEVLQ